MWYLLQQKSNSIGSNLQLWQTSIKVEKVKLWWKKPRSMILCFLFIQLSGKLNISSSQKNVLMKFFDLWGKFIRQMSVWTGFICSTFQRADNLSFVCCVDVHTIHRLCSHILTHECDSCSLWVEHTVLHCMTEGLFPLPSTWPVVI